jgi:5-methylcytosine-specific restriction endonuclease McrA
MTSDVLVLNRNFYAIEVVDWRRALGLVYLERAMVVDEAWRTHDFGNWLDLSRGMAAHPAGFVHTPSLRIAIPEVIALKVFGEVPRREVTFSRRNIYHHYGYRCCYCGENFPTTELNLDHILPRSRGGRSDWTNVVTSCIPCNMRKGNRLPKEAGMRLVLQPSRPKAMGGAFLKIRFPLPVRQSWQRFIDRAYWDSELEP